MVRSTPPGVGGRCCPEGGIQGVTGIYTKKTIWLVETLLGKQYFIAQSVGKSWQNARRIFRKWLVEPFSSESNTKAWEIVRQLGCQKSVNFGDKNQDISESMCSFYFGAIFWPSLGHKLSRNAFVVSILFPERISYWSKGSEHDTEKSKNAWIFDFSPTVSVSVRDALRSIVDELQAL